MFEDINAFLLKKKMVGTRNLPNLTRFKTTRLPIKPLLSQKIHF